MLQLNFRDPFSRLRNWLLRVEPPSYNILHIIIGKNFVVPRGLVVRIRCSHRRGSDSIPGVGIVPFFENLNLFVEGIGHLPRLCGNLDSLRLRGIGKFALLILVCFLVDQIPYWLNCMTSYGFRFRKINSLLRLVGFKPTNKGGKFLKKLWCCAGGSITR